MKAAFELVNTQIDYSFSVEEIHLPYFISRWHFHPRHVEIILITKGTGNGLVGDSIQSFGPGTLALIGANLPHVWLNDKSHYQQETDLSASAIVLKFKEDMLGQTFLNLPGLQPVRHLIEERSKRGLLFFSGTLQKIAEEIQKMLSLPDFERIIKLLEILKLMSCSEDFQYLSSAGFTNTNNLNDCDRIDRVHKYVMENFNQKITLQKAASLASLTPNAFCKYFKERTGKTFFEFINEIRIGYARKYLLNEEMSVSQIGFECGFNTVSNFYKMFNQIAHMPPKEYRKKYGQLLKVNG